MEPQTTSFYMYGFHVAFTAAPRGKYVQMRKLRPSKVEHLSRSLSRAGMELHVSLTAKSWS